jgi:hypothetical protein
MKFNLTANSQSQDGFKLQTQAETKEEMETIKELTKLLIEKISKIEVSVNNEEY